MTDTGTVITRLGLWGLTVLVCAATRLPAARPDGTVLFLAAASATLVLVFLSTLWAKAPVSLRGWVLLASLGVVLVPTSASAAASWLPAWAVALLYVVTLHVFFRDDAGRAPRVGPRAGTRSRWHVVRFIPVGAAAAVLVAVPFAFPLLPWRMRAVFELQTAFEPVLPVLLLAVVLVIGGLLRNVVDGRADVASQDAAADPERAPQSVSEEVGAA